MEETLWKKWNFLKEYKDSLVLEPMKKIPEKIRKDLVLSGGTSLHLYSAPLIFKDEAIRASEDIDFFNRNTKIVENPEGIEEEKIAGEYAKILENSGFECEERGNIVLVKPHNIKVEFFYDSNSFPSETYAHKTLEIISPKTFYKIKLNLLTIREEMSERDLIDILYLSTKYGFPEKIYAKTDIDSMIEWRVIEGYISEYGEKYFKEHNYEKLVQKLKKRVVIDEKN